MHLNMIQLAIIIFVDHAYKPLFLTKHLFFDENRDFQRSRGFLNIDFCPRSSLSFTIFCWEVLIVKVRGDEVSTSWEYYFFVQEPIVKVKLVVFLKFSRVSSNSASNMKLFHYFKCLVFLLMVDIALMMVTLIIHLKCVGMKVWYVYAVYAMEFLQVPHFASKIRD